MMSINRLCRVLQEHNLQKYVDDAITAPVRNKSAVRDQYWKESDAGWANWIDWAFCWSDMRTSSWGEVARENFHRLPGPSLDDFPF